MAVPMYIVFTTEITNFVAWCILGSQHVSVFKVTSSISQIGALQSLNPALLKGFLHVKYSKESCDNSNCSIYDIKPLEYDI
jgi:hypothetical protein